jgi:hypothetical protein
VPASTIQILGAEKALFRALKTKHDTPKYGLIFHASLVGQAPAKYKGKVSRALAAKCALAVRRDAARAEGAFDDGAEGRRMCEEVGAKIDLWMAPPPLREKKALKAPEEGAKKSRRGGERDARRRARLGRAFVLRALAVVGALAVVAVVTGVLTQVFVFAVMDKLDVSGREAAAYTGPAFTVGAVAVLLAQLVLIPRLHMKNKTLMWVGCVPLLIGAVLMIFANNYASLILSQFLIGLGQGLARPGFSSGASLAVPPQLQGNVAGLVISANGMGYIVTPLFGLFVYEYVNPHLPFVLCAAMLLAMFFYARFGMKDGLGEIREGEE